MRKIVVGIAGAGFSAERHAAGFRALQMVEIGGVAGLKESKKQTEEFAKRIGASRAFTDYEELLKVPDIEIISVCAPNYLHEQIAVAAAERSKHIIVEKPLARTIEQAESMVSVARKANVKLMYAENFQYAPSFVKAEEIVSQGGIGEIFMASAREAHSGPHSRWFYELSLAGGGALIDLGIHDIQLLRMFTKSEPKEVSAFISKTRSELRVEDNGVAAIKFGSGALGTLEESWTTKGGYDIRVELYGKEGQLVVNPTHMTPIQVFSATGFGYAGEKVEFTKGWTFPIPEEFYTFGYIQEIEHFVKCVLEDKKPNTSGEDGLIALKTIMAMYESAKTGKIVPVKIH
nr:Gfo/Idh/MocA family oxidoreductase [Candidatus Njordarchaeum guaymaensis]